MNCIFPHAIVSESNAVAVDVFQDYIQKKSMLKRQYRVGISF